jgi:hypothetical protein
MSIVTDIHATSGAALDQQTLGYISLPFKASAAVARGAVVAIGTDGQVAAAGTASTATLSIGIATKAAAAGEIVQVAVLGYVPNVPATGSVAAGDALKRSVTTTGSVSASAAPVLGEFLARAVNASASNVVDVWVAPGGDT